MRLSVLLLVAPLVIAAQTTIGNSPAPPAQALQAGNPADLCAVEGQIFHAVTGEPISRASVLLSRMDAPPNASSQPQSYTTLSDQSGTFAMRAIEPGQYRMTVVRNGFVTSAYGARGPSRPGTPLTLSRAQSLKKLEFRLTPHGVVAGRVLDDAGEGVPHVLARLLRLQYVQGRKQLVLAGSASTNDLGDYRLFGITPGKYYLSATAPSVTAIAGMAVDNSATSQPEEDYVPAYYPGTSDPSGAAALEVTGVLNNMNLTLSKAHTIHIKGHVVNHASAGSRPVQVWLFPRSGTGLMGALQPNQADAKGNFDIRGVAPGSYSLLAGLNDGGKMYSTRLPVEAGASNIENLNVVIGAVADVPGVVRVDGDNAQDLSNVSIRLQPRESAAMFFGPAAGARLKSDRSFQIENSSADLFELMLTGLPDGFYVKSIKSGQTDVLIPGLDLTKGIPQPIEIVLSPNAALVKGAIQNQVTGLPAAGANVLLVPQEKERSEQPSFYRTAIADQNGNYTIRNVVPGEYKAFAWEEVENLGYMDTDFMAPFAGDGAAVSLREKDQKSLPLTLIVAGDKSQSRK